MTQTPPQNTNIDPDSDKLLSVTVDRYTSTYSTKSAVSMFVSLIKWLFGILIGMTLLVGVGAGVGYYFVNRLAISPPRPGFTEEKKAAQNKAAKDDSLPAGAYRGRVVPQKGLSLRAEPNTSAEKLGVAAYNQEVIVLKSNEDKEWLRIRVKETKKEGWVRSNNVEKLDVPKANR
jgi:hypothetical protein